MNREQKLEAACKMVLLMYAVHPWTDNARTEWVSLSKGLMPERGEDLIEVTTRNLCDAVRAALKT